MPLTLTCPHCRAVLRVAEPFPVPGDTVRCASCNRAITTTWPSGLEPKLVTMGRRFAPIGTPHGNLTVVRPGARTPSKPHADEFPPDEGWGGDAPPPSTTAEVSFVEEPKRPAAPPPPTPLTLPFDAPRRPSRLAEPRAQANPPSWEDASDVEATQASTSPPPVVPVKESRRIPVQPRPNMAPPPSPAPRDAAPPAPPSTPPPASAPAPAASASRGLRLPSWRAAAVALVVALLIGLLGLWGLDAWYSGDLPSVQRLQAYRPATVTTVYAKDGSLMGEIYEQRRYVLPLDQIPDNLKNAFIAAEDANFYQHGGIDYMGIARAAGRNILSGRFAQGGSTITQQVAKNFLLTSDRKLERKIKEALLAWRIEEAYDKDHILYLYLNEIFLGAQAYGVEAAARTFFGKSVKDLTLGESAMLAGLPPRPSAWNPQADFAAAKTRQEYVLDQMLAVGFINERQSEEARKETIHIAEHANAFRQAAPSFTEYVRRQLIEKYGEDKVLHDGLKVTTTCDPALQAVAQQALVAGVTEVDEKVGFRRDTIEHVDGDAAINARISEIEEALRQAARKVEDDPASRSAKMTFTQDQVVQGVITKVSPTWAEVSVGRTAAILPIAWSTWVYPPDLTRDWKYRVQDDFTRAIDENGDGVKEGGILRVGDVVTVKVKALSTVDDAVAKAFAGTPGATTPYLGVRLVQPSELQGALLSFDVHGDEAGAVRSMVGGVDFDRSELNRAFQSRRQVGSTFKAIVYAAAIESKRLTAASIVPDAPLAFVTEEGTWKPENYGGDYRGNITLRQAITLSRNTSTVRVLDSCDPNMGRDVVYDFARRVGLGGPPTHALPEGFKPNPDTAWLCPWLPAQEGKHCTDSAAMPDGKSYCRACDLSIGLGSAALSVDEMARAFAVFASGGTWVEPYTLVKVEDRDGQVLEEHKPVTEPVRVISPELSVIATWLLESVATNGTGAAAHRELQVHVAGKTGTTNDEKDAWFIGYTPNTLTAVWVGYDQPKTIGLSATGGSVALPIWIDYMKAAIHGDTPFPVWAPVEWAQIDESTGRRVSSGGMAYPFLPGTSPEASSYTVGQASLEDLATEL